MTDPLDGESVRVQLQEVLADVESLDSQLPGEFTLNQATRDLEKPIEAYDRIQGEE